MIVNLKNNKQVLLRQLTPADIDGLVNYLHLLSPESRSRFGPHAFARDTVLDFYNPVNSNTGYIAVDVETNAIVAYAIIKQGFLPDDGLRLKAYGLVLSDEDDCNYA